jgi:hypothetical protein
MTEQPDESPRRVVKKVVKKTVVRPGALSSPRSTGTPVGRPAGAPVSTTTRPGTARLTTPSRPQARRAVAPAPKPTPVVVEPAAASGPGIRGRASDFGQGIGHGVHDAVLGVRHRIEDAWDWLVSLRLPHLSPVRGSAVTGVLVGLISVTIGWGFYEIFSATLGTQAGGKWGFLAFVFLSFIAYLVGEVLLAAFGVPHAHVVSILSVLLVLLLVLVFFLDLAAGVWAWLLVPVLFAVAFVVSSAVMEVASKEKNPQRLPWEPVDESQVKRD